MPKKISVVTKREWLKAYEDGKPEASIAREDHCDTRTVKRGIEEARLERDARYARAELLKAAVHEHNRSLIDVIGAILPALEPLPFIQPVPWREESFSRSVAIPGGTVEYEYWQQPEVLKVTLDAEAETAWELLRQHLGRDHSWAALERWKKALASHFEARMAMERKLASLLKEKTGYELVSAESPEPPYLNGFAVHYLSRFELERLLGAAASSDAKDQIVADADKGQVRYGEGTGLAHVPGKEKECRQGIIDALDELRESTEARRAVDTFKATEKPTAKARQAFEEIRMLGVVPGRCRICRRLGM